MVITSCHLPHAVHLHGWLPCSGWDTRPSQRRRNWRKPVRGISVLCCTSRVKEQKCGHDITSSPDYICSRRDTMLWVLFGSVVSSASSFAFACRSTELSEEPDNALQVDAINAYSYLYPLKLQNRSYKLSWVESRKPERYSSAAPLSPDARQRIVSERLDIKDNIVISVSIGPPNPAFLKTKDKKSWNANDVANSVLCDKSTARMTTGQRIADSEIVNADTQMVDGQPYWYYEYLTKKSPGIYGADVYRHSLAATSERDGYLYSLTMSTIDSRWSVLRPLFKKTIASFHMVPPTKNYVPPYKDPWRFW
eukprot:c17711_g1_i2 orf=261-1184(-)